MQKWEYYVIVNSVLGSSDHVVHSGRLYRITSEGLEPVSRIDEQHLRKGQDPFDMDRYMIAKAIAELGDDGWEMVTTGPGYAGNELFFKPQGLKPVNPLDRLPCSFQEMFRSRYRLPSPKQRSFRKTDGHLLGMNFVSYPGKQEKGKH